ncbi:hypothetical protein B0H13DRAFT_1928223 [Mycena leptocephala]|nr:hypothetical protein B0H13DRAFT_1928223 [Mycena leptocephala]
MPHQPTITELRINDIIICLKPAVTLLNEVDHSFGTPFVQAIANTTLALIVPSRSEAGGFHRAFWIISGNSPNCQAGVQRALEVFKANGATSDGASSIYHTLNSSQMRNLQDCNSGAGGMGKTTLAKAALHHPASLPNMSIGSLWHVIQLLLGIDIAALIGAHIGLNPGKDLTKQVLQSAPSSINYYNAGGRKTGQSFLDPTIFATSAAIVS